MVITKTFPDIYSNWPQFKNRLMKVGVKMKRVLLVDDDDDISTTLSLRLKNSGFDVLVAKDGVQGLDMITKEIPDIVLLDLYLPGMAGEEVCKKVRLCENKKVAEVPIIMLTAKNSAADRIVGKVIGANAYITKPFEYDDLLVSMRRFLESN